MRELKRVLPPLAAAGLYWLSAGSGLSPEGRATAALALLMALWWVTEALPLAATSLVPLALFPLLGAGSIKEAAAPYAHPLIFLFMGGFMVAAGMERCALHKRMALSIVSRVGSRPSRIVGAFMGVTAFLSMWVSNTATALMMLSLAGSVIGLLMKGSEDDPRSKNFAVCMALGIAYAASIGGIATLVGTPPNGLLAAFVEQEYGRSVTFASWLAVGLPVSAVLLPACWLLLTRWVFPVPATGPKDSRRLLQEELKSLGPIRPAERRVFAVFAAVAAAWCLRPLLTGLFPRALGGLNDSGIAIGGALLLFLLPDGGGERARLLDWDGAKGIPWGVLILFGGGLSLASAMTRNGVAQYLGGLFSGLQGAGIVWMILIAVVVTMFLTELTSNTAITAAFLPIFAAVAAGAGVEPRLLLIPTALAASCAFMLPVATPPNAIVFSTGYVKIRHMVKAGLLLNVIAVFLITAWTLAAPRLF